MSKRCFFGPSRCVMCGEEEESINHLMVYCSFSKEVWEFILNVFQIREFGVVVNSLSAYRFGSRRWKCGRKCHVSSVGNFGDIEI